MSVPDPPPGAPAAAGRRFCPTCGGAWDPFGEVCVACSVPSVVEESRPTSSLRSAIWLFAALATTSLLSVGLLAAQAINEANAFLLIVCLDSMIVLAWIAPRPDPALGLGVESSLHVLGGAALSALTFRLAMVYLTVLVALVGADELSFSNIFLSSGYGWALIVLVVCVQPAIFEEVAFRGVIQNAMLGALREREALLLTAFMFAVIHFNFLSFPVYFMLGIVLGVLRLRTGSLYPCIVLHFCHNGLCILLEWWQS